MADLAPLLTEIERLLAEHGWDQAPRLYALVPTRTLLDAEPQLADMLATADLDGLTPVEQEPIETDVEDLLPRIEWPETVHGCALVTEVVMLPDGAVAARPDDVDEVTWAVEHPEHRDVRLAVAVLRDGTRASTVRLRGEDGDEDDVVSAPDLAPNLADALLATFG